MPYYGQHEADDDHIRRGRAKSGTTHFHSFTTLCVVKANRRYTLALSLHRRSDTALDALKQVLDTARMAGLRIRRLMLDREFDNNAVVGYLLEQPFPTIMPLMIRGKKGGARRVKLIDPKTHTPQRGFDRLGRVTSIGYGAPTNTYDVTFGYDLAGNRTQALELLAHPATTNDVVYPYDSAGMVYQDTWAADAGTYMKSEQFSASLKLAFFGPTATLTVGTGVNHTIFDVYINGSLWQSFDGYAATSGEKVISIDLTTEGPHVLEIRNRAEHGLAAQGDVSYDESKFIVRFKQLVVPDMAYDLQTIEYTYDALSRLTEARYNPGTNVGVADGDLLRQYQYTYDLAGNRLSESVAVDGGTPTVTNYTYNAANQITNTGFTYDDNGNLTADGIHSYTWNRANRLRSTIDQRLTLPPIYSYRYDGLGNRIEQDYYTGGFAPTTIATNYLLDVQPGLVKVLAATTSGSTDRYVHGPRGIHAQEDNSGNWEWLVQDGLGSVRGVLDDTVSVDSVQSYAPYGEELEAGTFGSPFTFTGEQTDANGLVYLRARYYHPALGVFPSLDPVEGDVGRAMSLNRYGYVAGNVVCQ